MFKYSCSHFPTTTFPHPPHPNLPPSILSPFHFVHGSFIHGPCRFYILQSQEMSLWQNACKNGPIISLLVSMPFCYMTLQFIFHRVMGNYFPIPPLNLTWPVTYFHKCSRSDCCSSDSGPQENFHASIFLLNSYNHHENMPWLHWWKIFLIYLKYIIIYFKCILYFNISIFNINGHSLQITRGRDRTIKGREAHAQ